MGPLKGIKVVELAGIGPAPIVGMMLADLGAEVILVERATENPNAASDIDPNKMGDTAFFKRGKKSIALDLKKTESVEAVLQLVDGADVFIEGFRPGVVARLGLGPDICLARNPQLVYGHMTGWGQTGPLSQAAGHDMNYLSVTGALHHSGLPGDAPFPTPTIIGDVGGGSLIMMVGIVSALHHARSSGEGQVIDSAICDGSIYNLSLLATICAQGVVDDSTRGNDFFSAASPWCNTYECADGRFVTVQAIEPNFYQELITLCGFGDDPDFANQYDKARWPSAKTKMTRLFLSKSQTDWNELLEGTDACYAPVLNIAEASSHPHNIARENFIRKGDYLQPAPAPKFSVTPQEVGDIPSVGQHTVEILAELKAGLG